MQVTKTVKVNVTAEDIKKLIADALLEQHEVEVQLDDIKFEIMDSTPAQLVGAKVEVND